MAENTTLLLSTFEALIESKKYPTLREIMITMQPADIAMLFEEINEQKLAILFRLLPKELAAEAFVEMDSDLQELLIRGFSDVELKEVVDELYVDDAADIVEEMPANVVKRILRQADPEMRKRINEILKYPEDSAGSIMTTEYVSLRPHMTAEEAIKRIRRTGVDKETIYTCYVIDDNRLLLGYVTLKSILMADEDLEMLEIMGTDTISVTTTDDQEEVVTAFTRYDLEALPVVDKENRLVGIITVDDAIDVMHEEATEDIEKMAAITPSDKPYLKMGVFDIWKSRIPWLMILMISATFTGIIITGFENALSACLVLSSFIPMLSGTGGNSGTQSSVAVIRGLALDEIQLSDWLNVAWKEMRVSVLCGICLAAANFVKMMLFDYMVMGNPAVTPMVAFVVCLTLVFVVMLAKLVGCTLPLLAQRMGFDPAVMASPFITTIVDAMSLLIYFKIATVLLGI